MSTQKPPSVRGRIGLQVALAFAWPALASAQFEVLGPNLKVTSADTTITFRGPDVTEITNRITGESYLRGPAFGTLSNLSTPASADDLPAGEWIVTGDAATLTASDENRFLSLSVHVDAATQEIVVRVSGRVTQPGLRRLTWAVRGFDMTRGRFVLPAEGGVSVTSELLAKQTSHYFGVENSAQHWDAPLALYQAANGGIAVYSTDTQASYKNLTVNANLGQTANALFGADAAAPWPRATAAGPVEWRIAAYRGDWQRGARIYRDWHNRTMPAASLDGSRAWASRIRTVVKLYASPYDPAVLDDLATRVDPAQTLLYLVDWRSDPFDVNYPKYTPSASAKALAERAHQLGFRVMLHTNLAAVSPSHPAFASMRQWQAKDEEGEQLLGWNWDLPSSTPNRFAVISPAVPEYRRLFVDQLRAVVQDLRADALHLHLAGWPPNDGNGLISGLSFMQGTAELHKDLLAAFPGVVLSGEGTNDGIAPLQSLFQQTHWPAGYDADTAQPVPITAYVFSNSRPYGHLAFPNPYEAGFLSFLPQYESQAVLPTFSMGFTPADRTDYSDRDMARYMQLVSAFQRHKLSPEWDADWDEAIVQYRGEGASATLTDDGTRLRFDLLESGRSALLYQRAHGARSLISNLHIPDWPAYNRAVTMGLDPAAQYWLESGTNDTSLVHVSDLPLDVKLAAGPDTLVTPSFAYFKFQPVAERSFDFLTALWRANTGIIYDGVDRELADGAIVRPEVIIAGGQSRWAIAAQPPDVGPPGGATFVQYEVPIGEGYSAVLNFAAGIQDAAAGLRGALTFRVIVNGTVAWQRDVAPGRWEPGSVDLTPFLGRIVTIRFVVAPGPLNDASYAWSGWSAFDLRVTGRSRTIDVVLAVPSPVSPAAIVVPEGSATVSDGTATLRGLPLEQTTLVFVSPPASIVVGQSLLDIPFTKSQSSDGQLAGPSKIPYAGEIGVASSGGVTKQRALYGFSPSNGHLILSWPLRLPGGTPLHLSFSAGLNDGATPSRQGVLLSVRVNGIALWQSAANLPARWEYGTVDLSPWAGKTILIELVSDSLGQNSTHWTSWAELVLQGAQGGSCTTSIDLAGDLTAPASGRSGSIHVAAPTGCVWTTTGTSWVSLTPQGSAGDGVVSYAVAYNPGPARQTAISVAGHLVQVTQEASPPPRIAPGGIVNSASFQGVVAPGSLATIFGTGFAADEYAATGMPLPPWLGGLSVTVNGIYAPLAYAGPNQINFQVPCELGSGTASVVVSVRGVNSGAEPVAVAPTAPGVFTFGAGRAIAQNADYSLNTDDNPAKAGSYIVLYFTGGGATQYPPGTGNPASFDHLSPFAAHVSATIGGMDAAVLYAGLTPGYAGLGQINIQIPDLPPGTYTVLITAGGEQANSASITVSR